ncbi:MAG: hypothetical protein M1832_001633 [Thelocarpon impressellum]|nr:MAG: hypothetical protein M1832_001633 [Thelocarpon impressellum]
MSLTRPHTLQRAHTHRPRLSHAALESSRSLPSSPYAHPLASHGHAYAPPRSYSSGRGGGAAAGALTTRDIEDALRCASLEGDGSGDYFGGGAVGRYAGGAGGGGGSVGLRPRSPLYTTSMAYEEGDGEVEYGYGGDVSELVRRTNLSASLLNALLPPHSSSALLHPLLTETGLPPADFRRPTTLDAFKSLESSALDRILLAYRLPVLDFRGKRRGMSGEDARRGKYGLLLEFLGAGRVAEYERRGRVCCC